MRVSQARLDRQVAMTQFKLAMYQAAAAEELTDLELVAALSEVQTNLLGRLVNREHRELI